MGLIEGYRVNGGPAGEGLDPLHPVRCMMIATLGFDPTVSWIALLSDLLPCMARRAGCWPRALLRFRSLLGSCEDRI